MSFKELVFSDYARFRPGKASWLRVLARVPSTPGILASILLRAQTCLARSGKVRLAQQFRTLGISLVGADFAPGMKVGPGLMLVHPSGVTIGFGLRVGDNVTFAGGVTCAARYYDDTHTEGPQEFASIHDNAVLGANAVIVGGVRIGEHAMVGANSVVLSDVADNAVVMGSPARKVGSRGLPAGESTAVEGSDA